MVSGGYYLPTTTIMNEPGIIGARLSIPFFLGVNYDTTISPLPGCVSAERPGRYPPVIAGDYVLQRLNETYGKQGSSTQ